MKTLTMTASAKINLSLKVLGRRPDGYHDIESVMQLLEFGDTVTVSWVEKPGITLTCNQPELPTDAGNIAYRAAALMQEAYQLSGGFLIDIRKRIPVAAGLAGGSTNAAAVMHLVNQLCDLNLSDEDLAALGVKLGADVPFCLYGKPALAQGIGEKLTPVKGLSDCYIVLANPGIGVSTGMIYQAIDGEAIEPESNTQALLKHLAEDNFKDAFSHMENMMEPVAKKFCPVISELLHKIEESGADYAMMSGSGATCFGIFLTKPDENHLKDVLGDAFVALTKPI